MSASARRFREVIEPIASSFWVTPRQVVQDYASIGLDDPRSCYFTGRAAPLGRVTPAVVTAVFYNFAPSMVEEHLRWDVAAPETVMEARGRAVRAHLARIGVDVSGAVVEAGEALRAAAGSCRPEGRPLFAANQALPWPTDPLEALWQGIDLLREFRGDGHIAVLVGAGLDAAQAIVLNVAYMGGRNWTFYQLTRGWPDEIYAEARAALRERGFLDADGAITDAGTKFREMLEVETDRAAAPAFEGMGEQRAADVLATLERISGEVERAAAARAAAKAAAKAGDPSS